MRYAQLWGLMTLERLKYKSNQYRPLVLGVDPGFSGAVAVVDIDALHIVDMIDMPLITRATKSRKSGQTHEMDVHKLVFQIEPYVSDIALAVLESPGARPKQGLGSTYKFAQNVGQLHGILAGLHIPTFPITPQVWKGALGMTADKLKTMEQCKQIYSAYDFLWSRKKDHDRCEAALMAYYAKDHLRGHISMCRNKGDI